MQPYFFPYIGYYQLVNSVDEFIFFDDVNFIKKGFINRNTILHHRDTLKFTLPIKNISQNRKINEHFYTKDFEKFKNTLILSYKKSPYFEKSFPLIDEILSKDESNVAKLNAQSITLIFKYLGIEKNFSFSSTLSVDEEKKGQERIISICQKRGCTAYHNPIGAKSLNLYDTSYFNSLGIKFRFIKQCHDGETSPPQKSLSMIHTLMTLHPEEIINQLSCYQLIE